MQPKSDRLVETVTLSQARSLIRCLAHDQSLLLLSPPGIGKSDSVVQAAAETGLPCRSLLGTQIAPEDVSGVPKIVGERSVFCPPRILLPEDPQPFCLFLDELPACSPDVQKAFYSLLLERRLGEHRLPKGTWVVAAGNRVEDRALVRALSTALVNRVIMLHVRVDVKEWLQWAQGHGIREDILAFILFMPDALMRGIPAEPSPFSTPRAWASLSRALDLAQGAGLLDRNIRRALAFGRLSPEDAAVFCAMAEEELENVLPLDEYLCRPDLLPRQATARWFVLSRIRESLDRGELGVHPPMVINRFLAGVPEEHRLALLVGRVRAWGEIGAAETMLKSLREICGVDGEAPADLLKKTAQYHRMQPDFEGEPS
ncbi:MAG: ATP-binding protein [Gemmataceae bacterium]|nr:ATP-binding protein [Gemmataceae bacterium]